MPVGEIIGEAIGGVLKVAGRLVLEVVFELFIQGTGHMLIRFVRPKSDPSDLACGIVGILFWAVVGATIYAVHRTSAV